MNIISFDTEININKRMANTTKELSIIPKKNTFTTFFRMC